MYRKKGSPYWWIKYRDASGRTIEQSTQTADRAQAALVESKARAEAWQAKHHPAPPPLADPLFDEVLADYLESARLTRDISRDIYAGRQLAKAFAGRAIRAIQPVDIRRYLDDRRRAGVSDSTLKRELNVFCAACNWTKDENGLDIPNPAARRKPSEPPGRVRWLTQEQADALLTAAKGNRRAPWLADFIQLALMTGMRRGELLGLEWSRVDLTQRLIYFTAAGQQKNRQLGSLPLNESARQALLNRARFRATHCPASAWVFAQRSGERIGSIKHSWHRACQEAGLVDFHIHDLRHTCAAWLVQAGVPLLEVSHVLRHASIVMTQRYAHLAPHQTREALSRLESVGDNLATLGMPAESQAAVNH